MSTGPTRSRTDYLLSSCVNVVCLAILFLAVPATAESEAEDTESALPSLPQRYQRWYEEVDLLLSDAEREVFLSIREDYQRDHFIRRFWKARDPYLRTARNEFHESWQLRVEQARKLYQDLRNDERAKAMLTVGVPSRRRPIFCTDVLKPLEIWEYDEGSDRIRGYFTLVFIGFPSSRGRHALWQPSDGLRRLVDASGFVTAGDAQIARSIAQGCTHGDTVLSALAQSLSIAQAEERIALLPQPGDEWVLTFSSRSTDLPDNAEPLEGSLELSFPGRNQSRTVVQGLVKVPRSGLALAEVGEHRSYNLILDGEVLRKGELFDRFRYRFHFPAEDGSEQQPAAEFPVVVQRYLRPGSYELILKVEDTESKRVFRDQRTLEVPRVERRQQLAAAQIPPPGVAAAVNGVPSSSRSGLGAPALSLTATSSLSSPPTSLPSPLPRDDRTLPSIDDPFAEANASISTGDYSIKILALPDILTIGRLRVEARARGDGIEKVAFSLNGRPVMRKTRPPYSVEINLGDKPRTHVLRATALGAGGKELAVDEVLVNSGPHRFSVRLLEPQRGKRYSESVRAHVEVDVPEGEKLERVELFLNETPVATLYQPPFEQPILLTEGEATTYVRAVAYLEGGNSTEDVRFINAPDYIDEVDIQFVELYTTVVDKRGNFIEDLQIEDLEVFEDEISQSVRRFESMRDLPIRAGLVIDTSTSMMSQLRQVKKAAYRFFEQVLSARDRAALITFNDEPRLAVRFTNDREILAGGLAELTAEGETALYDTIIFSLHYFAGLKGKRAIVVLTDGEDSNSTYTYDEAIEFARRTGVAIYVVGLGLPSRDNDIRLKMQRLTMETGGELYLIDSVGHLERVYDEIQQELRSQYLIAYQSSQQSLDDEFREVEVRMLRKGLEAKTIRGYFPR